MSNSGRHFDLLDWVVANASFALLAMAAVPIHVVLHDTDAESESYPNKALVDSVTKASVSMTASMTGHLQSPE